ncbi:M56 family metallopeptidase [Lacipirellula sp.]|uniref:M56 family metallopeptidase n=1 Tax=Lacipirellula sp. TaxID=2691419 RepID=UPI003D0BEACD
MTLVDIAVALVRTTLATSLAALVAWGLLAALRVSSPRVHRIAWLLVISQGWLLFPFTIQIESPAPSPPKRAAGVMPAVIAEVEAEVIPFENEAEWGRGHFATAGLPPLEIRQSQKVPDPFLLAIAAWLFGAIVIIMIAAYRYLQVLRTIPLGSPLDNPQWQAEWNAARSSAKLRRHQIVTLRITAALGPLLHWAPWAYFILVPRPLWSSLEAAERTAILRHELAHLRRGDLWNSLAIRVLALPQWFNPLAWFAVRRFDEAAEWACDDAAARHADDRLAFANSLLLSAEYALTPYPASAPAARGTLTRRIHRLVSPRFKEESKMKLLILPLLLLSITAFQTFRIERVAVAKEAKPPLEPTSVLYSDAITLDTPIEERLQQIRAIKAKLEILLKVQRNFEGAAKAEYVIESPDIVTVKLRGKRAVLSVGVKEAPDVPAEFFAGKRCLVSTDGTIDLGEFGSVDVNGKTVDEAMRAVARKFMQFTNGVSLVVEEYNSKVCYVIVEDASGTPTVTRMPLPYPLRNDCNVGSAIAAEFAAGDESASLPDLSQCSIYVLAPAPNGVGDGQRYDVEWDDAKFAPNEYTNFPLFPGDRLFIAFPRDPKATKTKSDEQPAPPLVPAENTYRLKNYDTIKLRVERPHRPAHTLTWGDIEGEFTVDHHGAVELGRDVTAVPIAGLSVEEAEATIERELRVKSPDCMVQLKVVALAAEKFIVSVRRADGTELAVGAHRPSFSSEPDFLELSNFRSFVADLAPIRKVELERSGPHDSVELIKLSTVWQAIRLPQTLAGERNVRPGDRLIITVADECQPQYPLLWMEPCDIAGERVYQRAARSHWSPTFNTQFDHPDVQRPAGVKISF